ncbi:MAG: electron transfer flavoprotein subunit alpha/FixB family protein, partial [Xanthomarina gelatinilytica]|nr:electron transfer flavoprotein subunit alpha/FixB family protein [Xanthomarina gelatinilytica]
MSVLVYTESDKGTFKKTALEVASYAKTVADQMGTTVTAITFNAEDTSVLGNYGVDKVLKVNNSQLETFNAKAYASAIAQAAKKEGTKVIIVSSSADSKYLAPLLAIDLDAGYASNVVEAPSSTSPFTVKRTAFTNKAFNMTAINTDVKIVGVSKNAFGVKENSGSASAEDFSPSVPDLGIKVESVDKVTGQVTIADAE